MHSPATLHPAPNAFHTLAIVQTWPDHSLSVELANWLLRTGIPANQIIYHKGDPVAKQEDIITSRNSVIRDHVLPAHKRFTHILLLDRDIRPDQRTRPFLDADPALPILCAMHPVPDMSTWANPNAIHLGIVRIRREVFHKLAPPWFMFGYSADGCHLLQCECGYFAAKALAAGFTITRAGWAGHYHRRPGDVS